MRRATKRFILTPIADTSDLFSDFAPYVASVNDSGTVAFQAALRSGGTACCTGTGGQVTVAAESNATIVRQFQSHPDIDRGGALCVYTVLRPGGEALVRIEGGQVMPIADTKGAFARIGPLGPTTNDEGAVAFRADTKAGESGIFLARRGSVVTIADTTQFKGFQGLPVINGGGRVVFRADLESGGQGIYASMDGAIRTVATTGDRFRELGSFPSVNDQDVVTFSAKLFTGGAGIFTVVDGQVTTIVDTGQFESFRGALIDDAGNVIFYATPHGGQLGIYPADAAAEPIARIGASLFDSTVVDFALNPVSVNRRGQVAIRMSLAGGRQFIVRADPET
ncbi:MAG: hypothetical protein E6J50_02180 [Chloroflexi bacterium]|nr:MAG: hypothetical protein E6J50_02180 [Chloroflexota bacterium]